MARTKRLIKWAVGRRRVLRTRTLLLHYGVTFLVLVALMVTTHLLNRSMVKSSAAATTAIQFSNLHAKTTAEIAATLRADLAGHPIDTVVLDEAISRLIDMQNQKAEFSVGPFARNIAQANEQQKIATRVAQFAELAANYSRSFGAQRQQMAMDLMVIYDDGSLPRALVSVGQDIASDLQRRTQDFGKTQTKLGIIFALVILAEVCLVLLPAHQAIQIMVQALRRKTADLRRSQSALRTTNQQMEQIVNFDPLTGLPNRRSLIRYLADHRNDGDAKDRIVIMIGLDDFKSVNDMIGHDLGNTILVAVSKALKSCVNNEDIAAHLGGDEFVVSTTEPLMHVLSRINAIFADAFNVGGRRMPVSASIGFAYAAEDGKDPLDILADAELAMHCAKKKGGNLSEPFSPKLREDLRLAQLLQLELADALANGEIEPWFQPQINLTDGRLHGAEVLARWRHPTRGLIMPDVFLPAAEKAGLMAQVDFALWARALDYAKGWQTDVLWRPLISLNAAPETISDPHLVEKFLLILQRSGLGPEQVVLEVLENTLIESADDMAALNIDSLAESGISLELDDFGTGYASLAKLTQLPIRGIKLDRSLVAPLPEHRADSIVRAILALASELGLHVVAEGIEEQMQATHLSHHGCGIGQGYGFGRPMPPAEFSTWLKDHKPAIGPDPRPLIQIA